jgi:mono/diheme cytochrome c family protein
LPRKITYNFTMRRVFLTIAALACVVFGIGGTAAAQDAAVDDLVKAVEGLDDAAIASVIDALNQPPATAATPEQEEFFERHVRPVLAEHCFECHGPEQKENELRVDGLETLLTGGKRGPAIVPGDPDASVLIQAIRGGGNLKMPPKSDIPAEAIEALTHWVAMGAPWPEGRPIVVGDRVDAVREKHWAYQPVRNPVPPEVENEAWVRDDIDRFILRRLKDAGLEPSEAADRRTLLRRASYGLTGLPPTMDELNAFLADETPDAYNNMIDRLLASPRYGERWARHWLDLARYSDTKGYVFEEDRFYPYSHTYRDYVIRAFNEDVPYDRFIVEQLAADLLDLGEDKRPLAAMGFLTLGRRFLNNVHDITDDRIDVVTRGMLGLTVSCARCHDHKYDPIPAADYYAMYGVFRSTHEPGVEELPLISEPDPEDPQYQEYQQLLEEKVAEHQAFRREWHVKLLAEAREKAADYLLAAHDTRDITENAPFRELAKERGLHWHLLDRWRNYLKTQTETPGPIFTPWFDFAALAPETFAEDAKAIVDRIKNDAAYRDALNPRIAEAFNAEPPASMADVANRYGNVLRAADAEWVNRLAAHTQIAIQTGTAPTLPDALPDANAEALRQVLYAKNAAANFPENEIDELVDIPTRNRNTQLRRAVQSHQATHPGRPDRAPVLLETAQPFDPYVFKRGKPGNKGEDVPRRFLAVLTDGEPQPFENGSGRLEFAQAIASRDNPLTARVFVNRVWMHHFGAPIVGTTSDFGVRSDAPTHPDLLDHLATWFMDNGWSVKALHRKIMNSAAYRQVSTGKNAKTDPENRLLARQNAQRLDFEAMRDSLLFAAGTLDDDMGGPPVDITDEPFTTRRTVYGLVERQNLPGLFRTFDFASPDAHSPGRFETTVPQQALYLMNAPFAVQQARTLLDATDTPETGERVRTLYHRTLQRDPSADEIELAKRFVESYEAAPEQAPPPPPVWQYGYGEINEETGKTESFTPFERYSDGRWHPAERVPDEQFGYVSINERGGHTGRDNAHAAIRRWIAPRDAFVKIGGTLRHENENGDGVRGYIVSEKDGILWQGDAHNAAPSSVIEKIQVSEGDVLDFAATCKDGDSFDSFLWSPDIEVVEPLDGNPAGRLAWDSRDDFEGPRPERPAPLTAWEAYAQALLLSNEFMFVD